jgi:hypothetical protein
MQETTYQIGKYGRMRKQYLQTHRKGLFAILLTSGKLHSHLAEIDQTANDRMELITQQTAECEGVTEQLKAENQMLWVQKMNNIRNRSEESILNELIYS